MLPRSFYVRDDVVRVARELIGKTLCSDVDGSTCRVTIAETEAYAGPGDRASHAYGGRRTARTEPMFAEGGCAYVYLCYGIHHLFNVVTGSAGNPHAVLIRGATPLEGLDTMLERRGKRRPDRRLLNGPGTVAQALGITTALTGTSLSGPAVWLEHGGKGSALAGVLTGPRIGVDYAGEDAARPYRFVATGYYC